MSEEVERIFRESGAILEGHFLLASGLHSPLYLEKFRVLQYPSPTVRLCEMIAQYFGNKGTQVVTGPTMGGIILAFEVARQLGVRGIFAEQADQGMAFRRGFSIERGEQVLVVDDILTTGSSIRQVITEVRRLGGQVVGVGVLIDRSQQGVDFGVPLFSCHKWPVTTYQPQECPLCQEGVPLVKPGGIRKR